MVVFIVVELNITPLLPAIKRVNHQEIAVCQGVVSSGLVPNLEHQLPDLDVANI